MEIKKYVSEFTIQIITILSVLLSNLFYGIGTFVYLFGLRKLIEKRIYRNIKKK